MKTAMKRTTGILAIALTMTLGGAFSTKAAAQNPDAIDNARSVVKSLQQKQANDTDAALKAAGVPAANSASKPAAGAPAPTVKPAAIPGQQKPIVLAPPKPAATASAAAPASKPVAKSAAPKTESASGANNRLQKVNVVPGSADIQIEISSTQAVTPNVSKLNSPARILVELPETVAATAQNKIPVGSGGVKSVRIGMDGKNPPTTSVVVDLEKALTYDVAPGPAGKVTLILHTQGGAPAVAKNTPAAAPKPQTSAPVVAKAAPATKAPSKAPETKVAAAKVPESKTVAAAAASKTAPVKAQAKAETKVAAAATASSKPADAPKPKEEKKWAMNGKRDPFFSPVVQQQGSGCSTGKKCLEINAINLRGVVKSDTGFIAVVTNNIGKAYFLRENDPVFNGFVVKITGDSVTFSETVQDKLGKAFTREVVKKIFTPAV